MNMEADDRSQAITAQYGAFFLSCWERAASQRGGFSVEMQLQWGRTLKISTKITTFIVYFLHQV